MPEPAGRAGRRFFAADPVSLARRLLGCELFARTGAGPACSGVIVEAEAYLGVVDRAAHSFGGRRTARTEPMFGPPGTAYVYFTYGMHHCFNVACGAEGDPVAVLVRALEPRSGLDQMRRRRHGGPPLADALLCAGPGRLCRALAIDRSLSGADLATTDRAWIIPRRPTPPPRIGVSARIGVEPAGEPWASRPLRFYLRGHPGVSRSPRD